MVAKSVENQNGQYRAKQVVRKLPGVCNERMLPPKGKVRSELYRNVQKLAEMTNSRYKP